MKKFEFFKKLFYWLLLINAVSLIPIAYDLYSYHGLIGTRGWDTSVPWYYQGSGALINVLSHPANYSRTWVWVVFVVGQLVFLILGLLKIWPRFSALMIFFFTINLFLKGGSAFTGGEVLAYLMLLYMVFIHPPKGEGFFADLQNMLNNTFYWIMLGQVCILYLMSALYKLIDPYWLSGEAIMYITRIDAYSSPMLSFFNDNFWLSAIATYLTLIYQTFFALAVWIKPLKIPFLIFGVFFHLLISIGMGIFNFGLIMIVMYILFLDDQQLERFKQWFRFRKKRLTESA